MKAGRFGPYVNHGKINATIPKGTDPASLTLDGGGGAAQRQGRGRRRDGRLLGEHPDGGPVTVRDGRFGPYVNWGKVNATLPKGATPDSVTLSEALDLIAEREGRPAARPARGKAAPARKAQPKGKAAAAKAPAKPAKTRPPGKPPRRNRRRQKVRRRRQAEIGRIRQGRLTRALHAGWRHTASMLLPSGSRTKAP